MESSDFPRFACDKKFWKDWPAWLTAKKKKFPGLNYEREMVEAHEHLLDSGKGYKNMRRFVGNWLKNSFNWAAARREVDERCVAQESQARVNAQRAHEETQRTSVSLRDYVAEASQDPAQRATLARLGQFAEGTAMESPARDRTWKEELDLIPPPWPNNGEEPFG